MDNIAVFYSQGGVWMHPITLCSIVTPLVCIVDGVTRGRYRLSSICLALVGTVFLFGFAAFCLGLKQACDGFAGVGAAPPEQRQLMIASGIATALNASTYAMMVAAPLLGLTMTARLFHLPQNKKTDEVRT